MRTVLLISGFSDKLKKSLLLRDIRSCLLEKGRVEPENLGSEGKEKRLMMKNHLANDLQLNNFETKDCHL